MKVATNSVLDLDRLKIGSGEITPNTHSITLTSTTNTDKAYIYRYIAARAGTHITVRATARCLGQPERGKEMKLGIDNYKQGLVAQIVIDSTDWKTYEVSTVIPYDKNGIVNFKAVIGAWANQIASVEVAEFDVLVENSGFATARIHAMGVIDLTVSSVKLNAHYATIGIRDLLYHDATLTIQTDNFENAAALSISPVQIVQLQANVKCPVQAYISDYNRLTGIVKIKFASLQTGENVDIRTATYIDGVNVFKLHFTSLF